MNCFNHHESPALGICKNCNKGICKECLSDLGNGLACNLTCVEEVKLLNSHIARNLKMTDAKDNFNVTGILYLILGAVMFMIAFSYFPKVNLIIIILATTFVLYGIFCISKAKSFRKVTKNF